MRAPPPETDTPLKSIRSIDAQRRMHVRQSALRRNGTRVHVSAQQTAPSLRTRACSALCVVRVHRAARTTDKTLFVGLTG